MNPSTCLASHPFCLLQLYFSFLFIEFIEITMVNKIIQVSVPQFHNCLLQLSFSGVSSVPLELASPTPANGCQISTHFFLVKVLKQVISDHSLYLTSIHALLYSNSIFSSSFSTETPLISPYDQFTSLYCSYQNNQHI